MAKTRTKNLAFLVKSGTGKNRVKAKYHLKTTKKGALRAASAKLNRKSTVTIKARAVK